jgi:hypothetical protein
MPTTQRRAPSGQNALERARLLALREKIQPACPFDSDRVTPAIRRHRPISARRKTLSDTQKQISGKHYP